MFFSILLIFLFVFVILIIGYKKHFTWAFCAYFLGVAILFWGSVVYTLRFSAYRTDLQFEQFLYRTVYPQFSKFNMNITDASTMINIGLAFIMFGSAYLIKIIRPKKRGLFAGLLAVIVLFCIANYHVVCYREFLLVNSDTSAQAAAFLNYIVTYTDILSYSLFIIMMILPYFYLIKICLETRIHLLIKDSVSSCICLAILHAFIIYYFVMGAFSPFMPWKVDLLKFPLTSVNIQSQTLVTPLLLMMLIATLYILIKFNPFSLVIFQTQHTRLREYSELNHSLKMIFHVNKNILQTIYLLSGQAIDFHAKKPDISLKNMTDIKNMALESQGTLTRMLTMLDDISIKNTKINIIECIESAVSQIHFPPNITLSREYDPNTPIYVCAAPVHIIESFTNVLKNSLEAIEEKNNSDGKITLFVSTESNYVNIEITDNGCGIASRDIKHIFNVLHSTKKNSTNWGVGLAYVKKVVNVYNGSIYVKSELGNYTKIQLVFPLAVEKRKLKLPFGGAGLKGAFRI